MKLSIIFLSGNKDTKFDRNRQGGSLFLFQTGVYDYVVILVVEFGIQSPDLFDRLRIGVVSRVENPSQRLFERNGRNVPKKIAVLQMTGQTAISASSSSFSLK